MAAMAFSGTLTLTGTGEPKALTGVRVTSQFFNVMGVQPILGRGFVPEEDEPGHGQVLVLSERLWRERFGAGPGIVGRKAVLDGRPFEIVGVMGDAFNFPTIVLGSRIDYWSPIPEPIRTYRGRHYLSVVGRLEQGVSIEEARADMARIARDLTTAFPQLNHGHEARVVPLQGDLVRDTRALLLLLMGAVCCLLLVGCSNVASLLLTRGLLALTTIDTGYTTHGLLAVNLTLPAMRYQSAVLQRQFYLDLVERTAALPGVSSVGATNAVPLGGAYSSVGVDVEGAPAPAPGQERAARYRIVSIGYFKTMQIPVVEGRTFAASDARIAVPVIRWFPQQLQPVGLDAPQPPPVAVVNAAMAKQFWPNGDPIGRSDC